MRKLAAVPAAIFAGLLLSGGAAAQEPDFSQLRQSGRNAGNVAAGPDWRFVMFRIYGARKSETDGRWVLDDAE